MRRRMVCVLLAAAMAAGEAGEITVRNTDELRAALRTAGAGAVLQLAPGRYAGGLHVSNLAGRADAPIIICASDPGAPPVFEPPGGTALQLSDCAYLVVRDLRIRGFSENGLNADDGGSFDTPAQHITFENLLIENIGPSGNHDALKLSGVDHFTVRRCTFGGWGGSAIDMVGCHHGVIEDCSFMGRSGFSQSSAVQMKGGTSDMLVRRCFFHDVGERAINLGGSTGLAYFRPAAGDYEATRIEVAGNRFVGGVTPIAWVTAAGGRFHHNTIVFPERWILRILQETRNPRFQPCHDGVFEHNLIVYDRRVETFVNVGPGTKPESFVFRGNAWYATEGARRPTLPTAEDDGVYQVDPRLEEARSSRSRVTSRDARLVGKGADGYMAP
ncbi:right-handed parallel beta-helix repeat-containing protein [bacterium]|nr:right-handed parallel beta-helix repeat-containing protein [bacterium]